MSDPLFSTTPIFDGGWTALPARRPTDSGRAVARRALRKQLPYRYGQAQSYEFVMRFADALRPDIAILDAGSGKNPAYEWLQPAQERKDLPAGIEYVGLDLSATELELAGPGAYDEIVAGDLCVHQPELDERFDLIVSRQLLEHVPSLPDALENLRRYLKPGGRMVAIFSSRNGWFSRADKLIPFRIKVAAMERLLGRDPVSVFPAHFDHCTHREVVRLTAGWGQVEVVPSFLGANYTHFSRPLTAGYLLYEEWVIRHRRLDLATHYVVDAVR